MYNDQSMAKVAENKEPDFQLVLSVLRQEISKAEELCKITGSAASLLKPISPNGRENLKANEPQPGVIGMLWEEINRLKEVNHYCQINYDHLKSVVGT